MEITKTSYAALSRAVDQAPSAVLGMRCVGADLRVTRGQVRPLEGGVAGIPVRLRPAAFPFVATQIVGTAPPGGSRVPT
jgi:hypothetical protein